MVLDVCQMNGLGRTLLVESSLLLLMVVIPKLFV